MTKSDKKSKVVRVPRIRVTYNKRGFRNTKQFSNAKSAAVWYALCIMDGLKYNIWNRCHKNGDYDNCTKYTVLPKRKQYGG